MSEELKKELQIFFQWLHEKEYGIKTFETGNCWFDGKYMSADEVVEQYEKEAKIKS